MEHLCTEITADLSIDLAYLRRLCDTACEWAHIFDLSRYHSEKAYAEAIAGQDWYWKFWSSQCFIGRDPHIDAILDRFSYKPVQARFNKLDRQGYCPMHRDRQNRLIVPVDHDPGTAFWYFHTLEDKQVIGEIEYRPGRQFLMNSMEPHSVTSRSDNPRYAFILSFPHGVSFAHLRDLHRRGELVQS